MNPPPAGLSPRAISAALMAGSLQLNAAGLGEAAEF
jgi:hypothetical protein